MRQRHFFSRGSEIKLARATWIDSTLERAVVKVLMQTLPLIGIHAHLNLERRPCPKCHAWPGAAPARGLPDLEGFIPARLFRGPAQEWARPLAIEVKRPKGGVEGIEQKDYLQKVRRYGGVAFFCRGLDECCRELDRAGVRIPEAIWKPDAKTEKAA